MLAARPHARLAAAHLAALNAPKITGKFFAEPPTEKNRALRAPAGACGVQGLSFDRRRRATDVPAVQLGRATLFRAVANEVFHSTRPPPVRVCVVSGLRQVRARALRGRVACPVRRPRSKRSKRLRKPREKTG